MGLTGVILDAPVPCPCARSFRGEWPRELARSAVLRRATSICVERESGWGSGDARRRRTWGIPTVAGEREAWVFDRGWRGRSNVALLPACVADLRSQGVAVVKWKGKVACPSGRRCSTRNAVWCHSHPGFKSQRYRHGEPRGPNQKLGPRGVLGSEVVAVRLTAVAAGRRAVVRAGQLESRPGAG